MVYFSAIWLTNVSGVCDVCFFCAFLLLFCAFFFIFLFCVFLCFLGGLCPPPPFVVNLIGVPLYSTHSKSTLPEMVVLTDLWWPLRSMPLTIKPS